MTITEPNQEMGTDTLAMQGASLDFGGGAGVFDLTFTLPRGAILGMIGPSGCGKTTTVRLLNGIYGPTAGEVRVFDKSPNKFTNLDKARIGYIPQHSLLYPNLSAEEIEPFSQQKVEGLQAAFDQAAADSRVIHVVPEGPYLACGVADAPA